ncbi:hypothetical protein GCM10027176_78720 [Actinoallomurus bryophytorum]|uniref:Uncharacterized protein n=1 Tax=Actinoallomurus bryophytorum TaxID=1490222 RepID=A0A543CG34_9ACTN|nr:hypothetical protein [Actinoallomurus bryophytorum]TQL95887.1 hypothetical protein FB559_1398 [Actinoallomurus bryophytorum]
MSEHSVPGHASGERGLVSVRGERVGEGRAPGRTSGEGGLASERRVGEHNASGHAPAKEGL